MNSAPIRERITFILVSVWLFVATWFCIAANAWMQLASMAMFLALLVLCGVNFVLMFMEWKTLGKKAVIPLLVGVIAVPIPFLVASEVKPMVFEHYRPDYEAFIDKIERNEIEVDAEPRVLLWPREGRVGNAHYVLAQRTADGLFVEFLTESGFPAKHSGFLYSETGKVGKESFFDLRWPRRKEIKPHWFRISG